MTMQTGAYPGHPQPPGYYYDPSQRNYPYPLQYPGMAYPPTPQVPAMGYPPYGYPMMYLPYQPTFNMQIMQQNFF